MYNKVILVGNLTRDIEMKFSQASLAIASAAIATSRKFTVNGEKRDEVCFVDITFFGRSAEIANQYLSKGSKILVEGRLVFDQWSDQNGQKRSKHSVTVDVMQMLSTKGSSETQSHVPTTHQAEIQNERQTQIKAPKTYADMPNPNDLPSIDIDEDEIPF